MKLKKTAVLFLLLALLLTLGACGEKEDVAFRALADIGTRQYCAVCRGGDELAPVIDAALRTLAGNGTLAAISARWLGEDRCCLEGDAGALAALESLPEPRVLIIGVEEGFNPVSFEENGGQKGMSPDLAGAIGALLGWEVRLQPIAPDEVAAQLSSGNVDCALGFDPGSINAGKYSVGPCYMESSIVLAVRPDSEVRRMKDLEGSRVGIINDPAVLKAVKASEKLTKYAAGATEYLSAARCISALDSGWCAAVAMDSLMLSFAAMN